MADGAWAEVEVEVRVNKKQKRGSCLPLLIHNLHYISREFFSQLNKEAVKGLYDKYVIDMEMWDYLIEPYLSYAGMVSWSKLNT